MSPAEETELMGELAKAFGFAKPVIAPQEKIEIVLDPTMKKITMPAGWNAPQLLAYAKQLVESEESIQQCHHAVTGIPADVLVGLWRVLEDKYQFAKYLTDKTWFGNSPPPMVNIKIGPKESISIPYAKISPPAWEGGYIRPVLNDGLVVITGEYKRKFQNEVDTLIGLVEEHITKSSIYRGKSIILNFDWKIKSISYNFDLHSPTFETPPNITPEDMILNADTEAAFKSSIYSRLQSPAACAANGIPFKHGVILAGKYGTGKTMAGGMISKMATDHGATFIHLKNAKYLPEALLIAKNYGRSVLYCEDIDQVVASEERGEEMDDILNTLDGVDTKNMEVMLIATTNHPERLNSAFMRAGRIDAFIPMGHPDAPAAVRLLKLKAVNVSGQSLLADDIDFEACGKVLAGKSPAFITGIITDAKSHCIANNPGAVDLTGKLTTNDIVNCALSKESQIKMTEYRGENPVTAICHAMEVVGDLLNGQSTFSPSAE